MDFESFVKSYSQKASTELEKEAVESFLKSVTVEFDGKVFPKETLTMVLVALVYMNDPRVDAVLKTFGLELKDVHGRKVFPRE